MKKPFGSNVISNGNNKVVRNDEGYKINAGSKEDRWKQNDPPPKRGNGTRFPLLRVEKDPSVVFGKPARLPVRSQTMCGKPGDCKTETRATAKEKTGLKVEKGKASEAEWEDSEGEGRSPEVQDLDEKVVDRKRLDKKTMAKNVSSYEEWKRKNNLEPNCKVKRLFELQRYTL